MSNLDDFVTNCKELSNSINALITAGGDVSPLIDTCGSLISQIPEVRKELTAFPAMTKRSFNFLHSVLVTLVKNLEDITKRPDFALLKKRLETNNRQLKTNVNSFAVMLVK